jgi:hypothetical protein
VSSSALQTPINARSSNRPEISPPRTGKPAPEAPAGAPLQAPAAAPWGAPVAATWQTLARPELLLGAARFSRPTKAAGTLPYCLPSRRPSAGTYAPRRAAPFLTDSHVHDVARRPLVCTV